MMKSILALFGVAAWALPQVNRPVTAVPVRAAHGFGADDDSAASTAFKNPSAVVFDVEDKKLSDIWGSDPPRFTVTPTCEISIVTFDCMGDDSQCAGGGDHVSAVLGCHHSSLPHCASGLCEHFVKRAALM